MTLSRVLIIRPGAIGDTLMVLPALKALQGRTGVCFAGRGPALGLVRGFAERVMDMETAGWHALFSVRPKDTSLPVGTPDAAVLFAADPDGRLACNLSRLLPQAAVAVYPSLPGPEQPVHVALYTARCLQQAGLPLDPDRALSQARARPLLGPLEPASRRHEVLLHPGSGGRHKTYPLEFWQKLLEILRGYPLMEREPLTLLLGPAEASLLPAFQLLAREMRLGLHFCARFEELCPRLRASRLYIGHDSGITHLAAMAGAPTVALFRQSSPTCWAPLGPRVKVLQRPEPDPGWPAQVAETAVCFAADASGLSCPAQSAIISPA